MSEQFDIFLAHNSADKPQVRTVANELRKRGLKPWLDEWELRPGLSWQELLEEQIKQIKSAAVFVGSSGFGPWQKREMRAFLNEFVERGCPVIPVLLENAPQKPDLPIFLNAMTWVDFRHSESNPIERLIWGITGLKPDSQTVVTPSEEKVEILTALNSPTTVVQPPSAPPSEGKINTTSGITRRDWLKYSGVGMVVGLSALGLLAAVLGMEPTTRDFKSAKGVDYFKLKQLLAQGKWKEADQETADRMLEAMGKNGWSYVFAKDIENFPCEDLCTIDQLWVKYSNGKFGFSVQTNIWLSVGKVDYDTKQKLGDRVGWRKRGYWSEYDDLTFDLSLAPQGHLPSVGGFDVVWWMGGGVTWGSFYPNLCMEKGCVLDILVHRAKNCNL